jgi:ABC-type multidrug transport system fused ATPase/permease subunit
MVEGMLVSLGLGGLLVLVLTDMSPGSIVLTLSLFAASAIRIMPSMTRIQYNLARILNFSHSLVMIFDDVANFATELKNSSVDTIEFNDLLKLDSITFRYENTDTDVLKDFSLEIKKNSSVAFVGPTGCGKTTLVDIILGLLKPQKGRILVDGVNIEENLTAWQKKIGYVPQFIFLLDDSVKANVAFGVPEDEIDNNRVIECLKMAQIYDFIKELPD